jgi:predicted permease
MDALRAFFSRCAALFGRKKLDAELDEELRAHIELATAEHIARGMTAEEARTTAMREFGGITQTREAYRVQRGLPWFGIFVQDIRYALRQLRKSPGFALTAILTIALGAGSVTAVFSVVDAVLLRPYAFRDSGRIIVWRETVRELEHIEPMLPDNYRHYLNLKSRAHTIQDAAIFQTAGFSVSKGTEHPREDEGLAISSNFFSVLGVNMAMGRSFTAEETQTGRDNEVIITWPAWQRYFHGDENALGGTLCIDGQPRTVVGILPRYFRFPVMSIMPGEATHGSTDRYAIFKPLVPSSSELTTNTGEFNFLVLARLQPGVTPRQAQTELDGIEKVTAAAEHVPVHLGVVVLPFGQEVTGDASKPLWLLLATVLSVLLMACVNLANLQLARRAARDNEIALRAALGAGRTRLLQGVLVENLIIGLAGGTGAALFAYAGVRVLTRLVSILPRMNEVRMSIPMLAFALGISLLTSIAFGILPALRVLRVMPQSALQSASAKLTGSRHVARSRGVLVAVQVAASVGLLIVTALITRSFARVLNQQRDFNSTQVMLAKAELSEPRYGSNYPDTNPGADPASLERDGMIDRTLDKLRALPGVDEASVTSVVPLSGDMSVDGIVRPDHPVPEGQIPMANRRLIGPGYFATMGIPILEGREFDQRERENSRAVILSQKAAKAAFPDEDPIGHKIHHWDRDYTVIGIAADARINDLKRDVAIYYLPYWDFPPFTPVFIVRSPLPAQALASEMRQTIWSIDPDVTVPDGALVSLDSQISESVAPERFQAILLSSFGVLSLLLAALGIYGVLSYSVALRTSEFGIRIALGAGRAGLARLVMADAFIPVAGGIVFGLLLSAGAVQWIRSLLYETSAIDPWAIGLSLVALVLVALAASLLPLRRALAIDPMQALRAE